MLFRQLFHAPSSTFTYLLAARPRAEALLIDPVKEEVPTYLELIQSLGLRLVFAVDTHIHADHVTGIGDLATLTGADSVLGEQARAELVTRRVKDGEVLRIDDLALRAIYTPGHTDDSYSFVLPDRVFTGDTLLIRGTGRTDFQNGDPRAQYHSLFHRLLRLPDETLVFPGHDYNGRTESTIGAEKRLNPRLQVRSEEAYVRQMGTLDLPPPRLMNVAVPSNQICGLAA